MTKEQVYRDQMIALGIYQAIHEPEIKTLAKIERQITRAEKAWSATASPAGSAPSFLDPHFAIIQRLRSEALQHREALGITAKALAKLTGGNAGDAPQQQDLITSKLDAIAARVAGYDTLGDKLPDDPGAMGADPRQDPFAGIPAADEAAAISDIMDRQDNPVGEPEDNAHGTATSRASARRAGRSGIDDDLAAAVAEDMG